MSPSVRRLPIVSAVTVLVALLVPSVAAARTGDLYIGDPGISSVIRVSHKNASQKVVAEAGPDNELAAPDSGVFAAKRKLFIADYHAFPDMRGAVFQIDPKNGSVALVAGEAPFEGPTDVALAPHKRLYAVDPNAGAGGLGAVFIVDPALATVDLVSEGQLFNNGPLGIAVRPNGRILVSDDDAGPGDTGALISVNPDNGAQKFVTKGGHLVGPYGMTLTPNGKIAYLAETTGSIVRVKVKTGAQKVVADGPKFDFPSDVALGLDGKLYSVNDSAPPAVLRSDPKTGKVKVFASGGRLDLPEGITVQPHF
jgi:outer membrane protein assembly factor BamB